MPLKRPSPIDAVARELSIVDLLDRWAWNHGGVVIGGYAVAAYGSPRYSDDLDVATPSDGLAPTADWLKRQGPPFRPQKPGPEWTQNYSTVTRLVRTDATIDLIGGAVRDRDAQVDIPYDWVARDSKRIRLVLFSGNRPIRQDPGARREGPFLPAD